MSGSGARPKSQPQRKDEEKDTTRKNETSEESHMRDITRLFRDNERMKNRLSALQSQLESQLKSEHKGSNISLSHDLHPPDQIFLSSENEENPVRNSEKEKNPIRRDTMLNNRRVVQGPARSPNQQFRQNITSNQLSQQNSISQETQDGSGYHPTLNGNTVLAQQNQLQVQGVLPIDNHLSREHIPSRREEQRSRNEVELTRNEVQLSGNEVQLSGNEVQPSRNEVQLSRNEVQLSRREVELLYSEMRLLQDEIEQHRSRFQENSQPTLQDYQSESEDLDSITNLNISRQRRDNGDVNISCSQSFTEPRTSRTSTTQRQTRSTSYLLGPDLLSVETENVDPSDTDEDMTENNLVLLTAQYEKTQDEELYVPPAMSLLNNWNQQQSSSTSSIPNQLRSTPATSSLTNQLRSPTSNTNQLNSSSNQPVSSAFISSNQLNQVNTAASQLAQATSSANHLIHAISDSTQLSQATGVPTQLIQTAIGVTITQPTPASRAANQLTTASRAANQLTTASRAANQLTTASRAANQLTTASRAANQLTTASRAANQLTMATRASNELNYDISVQPVPRQSHLDSSQRLVNPTYSTDEIRSMALSNQYRNQTAAPKRSVRNQNELERQIQEQRDELARLIQKARSSPNMNEWHQEQAKTSDNKNTSHVNKTKNLKRGSVASVNIPPSPENSHTLFTVNGSREEEDRASIVSEELSDTADNSFHTLADRNTEYRLSTGQHRNEYRLLTGQDRNEYRLSTGQQMERLRNIQNELDRLADQMERLSSSDLNAGSCLFPSALARNVPQELDINVNSPANLNNQTAARLNYNAARSSTLTDRTVNMISTVNGLNSQIGTNNLAEYPLMSTNNSSSLRLNNSSRLNGRDRRGSRMLASPSGRKTSSRQVATSLPAERLTNNIPASRQVTTSLPAERLTNNIPASRQVTTSLPAERLTNSLPASSRITNSVTSSRLLNSNRSARQTTNNMLQDDIIPGDLLMQQLALSVNQIHQVFWDLRRDLTRVIDRVSALELQMTAHDRIATLESQLAGSSSHLGVPDSFGMTAATSRILENDIFENYRNLSINGRAVEGLNLPPSDPYFDLPLYSLASTNHSQQFHNLRNEPVDELLSRFLADPLHQHPVHQDPVHEYPVQQTPTPPDSGVSSGALNNQVSPGMRANNYYDNFRSFSRQNRLDSLNPSPPDPANRLSQPHGSKLNEDQLEVNQLQHGVNLRQVSPGTPPANNAPSSYVKTRKKHKINREQNRNSQAKNSTNLSRDAQHYARAQNIAQTESQSDISTQSRRGADANTKESNSADISPHNLYSARASQDVDANYGVSDLASNEASDVASNANENAATLRNREVTNPIFVSANAEGSIDTAILQENLRLFVADNFESRAATINNLGTAANTSNSNAANLTTNDDTLTRGLSAETSSVLTNNSYIEDISDNIYSQIESLITNHESSPEFLASLLEDLTILSSARGHFYSPNRSHTHERSSRLSTNTKIKKQNPVTNNLKYNHNLSDSSTDDSDTDKPSTNRRMAGSRVNNRVSSITASTSTRGVGDREVIRTLSLASSGSYSTPAHRQIDGARSLASLETTPLTQQWRNNSCNVITPNPSYPPNNASTPNTGHTNNLTPRIIPNLSRKDESLNPTPQADTRNRSQKKQVAVVAAQSIQGSCSPLQQNIGQQQNLGVVEPLSSTSNNTVLVEPRRQQRLHYQTHNQDQPRPHHQGQAHQDQPHHQDQARAQPHHQDQPHHQLQLHYQDQSHHGVQAQAQPQDQAQSQQARPHKDSMQLHRVRTHHPNHQHRSQQQQIYQNNDPRQYSGQQEDTAVNNREILSGYSVPKNQQRRNVVRGEQRKLTPHNTNNRQDDQSRQELSRPALSQESTAQVEARQVFPTEESRVELSSREITHNDLSTPVVLLRQGLSRDIQNTNHHLDNQGFLTVQLQQPPRLSNSVRNEHFLKDGQLSSPSQSTQKREAAVGSVHHKRNDAVDSVHQQGAVALGDNNNLILEQEGIAEAQNISLAEGDGDGVADLAEADQAHTEEQDPVAVAAAAAALPEPRQARDARGELDASFIRQNVITSNQVRNSALFQHQSKKAERGVRNDNVHNFSQLKCSPGAGNAAQPISSSNQKPSYGEKDKRTMQPASHSGAMQPASQLGAIQPASQSRAMQPASQLGAMQPVQQISASPLNLRQNFNREYTESSQQQHQNQLVAQQDIEDGAIINDDHDEYNRVVRNNDHDAYAASAIYDNRGAINDDHDEYNRGTMNADRDEYDRGVINDDHDEYTRGAINEDDDDEYNRVVRSTDYDEYDRVAMNANRDEYNRGAINPDNDEFENERFNDEQELLDTEGEEEKELILEERDNELEMMNGLDRVPIRLPSNQATHVESMRLSEEMSNQAALLQEAVASFPELANTGSADTSNTP